MAYIAENPGLTVTEVHQEFEEREGYARGTVLKMMERLRDKGFLDRKDVDKFFRYFSTHDLEELQGNIVDDIVDSVFRGSVTPLISHMQRRANLSEDELEELRRLMKKMED
ncbi:MAG: BlaI/MecI/CopY family transcriptional regulator [Armatimonadetes bacterium]|nr:BlaI/MecI/CopY family transcriptional regulator [Armatimonadota bacterium]